MLKINNKEIMEGYVLKYNINDIFRKDMKPFMELLLFKKGEYICRDNEKLKYLFFFVDGKVKVYSTLSNGKAILLTFYEGFKVLGDLGMINSEPAYTNVQVIEDTYCIGISVEKVKTHLLDDAKFLRYICNSLSEKLNRCSRNSSINLLYPLENRLAGYILAMGENLDENLIEIYTIIMEHGIFPLI